MMIALFDSHRMPGKRAIKQDNDAQLKECYLSDLTSTVREREKYMKRISSSTVLYISVGFIILMWVIKIIRNTFYLDRILKMSESLNLFLLYAFVYGIFTVLVVSLFLHLAKEKYQDIGFTKSNLMKQLRFGILFGILIFAFDTFISGPIIDALVSKTAGMDIGKLFNNIYYLPALIFITLFKGGFSEELWRIFALTRFEKCFGKFGLIVALIIESIVFGIGHLYQGMSGMISIGIVGLFYGLVYLRKRSALEAVFAHAAFDLIGVILGFVIYARS